MNIKSLKLYNFRNYEKLNIEFSPYYNIIFGNNAQGKTNILEAIFLCSSGRSHRTSKDSDLVKLNEKGFQIKLDMERQGIDKSIYLSYEMEQKKKIKINEIQTKKIGDLIGILNTVIFSPEDLLIIKQGPSERRRFIDITLSQIRISYFHDLQQFSRILKQRNNLLKEISKNPKLIDTLEAWNENFVDIGSRIMKARNEYIKNLSEKTYINHLKLTNNSEKLIIKYAPSVKIDHFEDLEIIKQKFLKELEIKKRIEILKGSTLIGPQRDDYEFYLDDINLKIYGSQGQQRTSVLSMKLSEIEIMKEVNGEYPVLLLDDVMSELDNNRQEYLLNSLKNIQTFITYTEKDFFNDKIDSRSKFFYVCKGEIEYI